MGNLIYRNGKYYDSETGIEYNAGTGNTLVASKEGDIYNPVTTTRNTTYPANTVSTYQTGLINGGDNKLYGNITPNSTTTQQQTSNVTAVPAAPTNQVATTTDYTINGGDKSEFTQTGYNGYPSYKDYAASQLNKMLYQMSYTPSTLPANLRITYNNIINGSVSDPNALNNFFIQLATAGKGNASQNDLISMASLINQPGETYQQALARYNASINPVVSASVAQAPTGSYNGWPSYQAYAQNFLMKALKNQGYTAATMPAELRNQFYGLLYGTTAYDPNALNNFFIQLSKYGYAPGYNPNLATHTKPNEGDVANQLATIPATQTTIVNPPAQTTVANWQYQDPYADVWQNLMDLFGNVGQDVQGTNEDYTNSTSYSELSQALQDRAMQNLNRQYGYLPEEEQAIYDRALNQFNLADADQQRQLMNLAEQYGWGGRSGQTSSAFQDYYAKRGANLAELMGNLAQQVADKRTEDEQAMLANALSTNEQLYSQTRGDFADMLSLMAFNQTADSLTFDQQMQLAQFQQELADSGLSNYVDYLSGTEVTANDLLSALMNLSGQQTDITQSALETTSSADNGLTAALTALGQMLAGGTNINVSATGGTGGSATGGNSSATGGSSAGGTSTSSGVDLSWLSDLFGKLGDIGGVDIGNIDLPSVDLSWLGDLLGNHGLGNINTGNLGNIEIPDWLSSLGIDFSKISSIPASLVSLITGGLGAAGVSFTFGGNTWTVGSDGTAKKKSDTIENNTTTNTSSSAANIVDGVLHIAANGIATYGVTKIITDVLKSRFGENKLTKDSAIVAMWTFLDEGNTAYAMNYLSMYTPLEREAIFAQLKNGFSIKTSDGKTIKYDPIELDSGMSKWMDDHDLLSKWNNASVDNLNSWLESLDTNGKSLYNFLVDSYGEYVYPSTGNITTWYKIAMDGDTMLEIAREGVSKGLITTKHYKKLKRYVESNGTVYPNYNWTSLAEKNWDDAHPEEI